MADISKIDNIAITNFSKWSGITLDVNEIGPTGQYINGVQVPGLTPFVLDSCTVDASISHINGVSNKLVGQALTLSEAHRITSFKIKLAKVGTFSATNTYVRIYNCTGTVGTTATGTGSALYTSNAVSTDSIGTTYDYVEFDFNPLVSLAAGDWVFVYDTSNNIRIRVNNTGTQNAGNLTRAANGTTWVAANMDIHFYLYGV